MNRGKQMLAAAAALGAAVLTTQGAVAAGAADFFKGKRLTYIIATNPGGGYDTYGRLTAKYLGKHLGAKVVVKNLPGAGHIIGANHIYAAKPDGTTIGTFNTGLVYAQALGREGVKFDLNKMSWIGKAAADPRVMLVGKETGVTRIDDLRQPDKPAKLAASGVGSAAYNDTKLLIDALGLSATVIPGFNGNEGEMAIMRGEVVGTFGSMSSLQPFVDNGYGRFLFHVGGDDSLGIPDAESLAASDDGKTLVALIATQAGLARLTAGPPGIPEERLAVLRDAYLAAWRDPELLAEAKKLGIPVIPASGPEVATRVRRALNISPQALALVRTVMDIEPEKPSGAVVAKIVIKQLEERGRFIRFDHGGQEIRAKPSSSRTELTIAGKEANRKKLRVGMECDIEFVIDGDRNEPSKLACR